MFNVLSMFRALIPTTPVVVGTVDTLISTGLYRVTLPGGGTILARGDATVGNLVFVRGNVIESVTPTLPIDTVDI